MKIIISDQDIGDFYYMVRWFTRNKGNTFAYLLNEMNERYPQLKQAYGDTSED